MAEEKQEKQDEQPAKDSTAKDSKLTRERLIAEAQERLGVPSHVVAGALADLGGTGNVSVSQAQTAVKKFLVREVEGD